MVRTVGIEAKDEQEALAKADRMYREARIVLTLRTLRASRTSHATAQHIPARNWLVKLPKNTSSTDLSQFMNRRDIYNKYDGHCAYCGKKIEFDDMTIDHIVPSSKGGVNTLDNTIPSCQLCNNQKADRSVESRFYAFALSAPAALQLESTSRVLSSCSFIENITETLDEDKQYRLALRYKKVVPVKPIPVKFYFEK